MHLFPESGFDQSAATPVFLGVLVSWFFAETLGWVFAGLVVPGYLATLFLLDPRSATIDVFEAALTYLCARAVGEHLSKTGLTSRVFGRERFLLVVVVSVLVRIAVEGVALSYLLPRSSWAYSIGLVVVPLAANACWKTGFFRGFAQHGLTTAIVYGMVRYVLVPHTNLSLAGFDLATENVAGSFLQSPKAYVLLLTGAVLAAFANIRFGWDYSGILIPALMALVVVNPVKFAATGIEVLILVGVVRLLVVGTRVGRWNIEGPRRVVLYFTTDYALRFAFAGLVGPSLSGPTVVEFTGFGYLLPALVAVKISQKPFASLVLLPAATVSVAAFGIGTLLGFTAQRFDGAAANRREPVTREAALSPMDPAAAALWLSALARPTASRALSDLALPPERLARLADAILADIGAPLPASIQVQRLDGDVALLRERFESLDHRVGDPAVLVAPTLASSIRLVAVVPSPLGSPECAALAARWLVERRVDAVVIAGIEESRRIGGRGNAVHSVARALARAKDARGLQGVVVALRRSVTETAHVRLGKRAAHESRVLDLLREAGEPKEALAEKPENDEDVEIDVPLSDAERRLWASVDPPSTTSATALIMAFDGVRPSSSATSVEARLIARRLVFEPLLDPFAVPPSAALLRASAAALGYRLSGPMRLEGSGDFVTLMPAGQGSVALLSRIGGTAGLVIEVAHGAQGPLRRLALRLGARLQADAVLVGLESSASVLSNAVLAEAHAVATWPRPGRRPRIVSLREVHSSAAREDAASVGSWGADGANALATDVGGALAELGITSRREPLGAVEREEAARSTFDATPVVGVTVDERALRAAWLGSARAALEELDSFPVFDGECGAAVVRLAALLTKKPNAAPFALLESARHAAMERSVVARRELEDLTATTASGAAVARASNGVYLVVVGREFGGVLAAAYPLSMAAPFHETEATVVTSLEACAATLAAGGTCHVREHP